MPVSMDVLSNAFSVLEIDVEDDGSERSATTAASTAANRVNSSSRAEEKSKSARKKKKEKSSNDVAVAKNGRCNQQDSVIEGLDVEDDGSKRFAPAAAPTAANPVPSSPIAEENSKSAGKKKNEKDSNDVVVAKNGRCNLQDSVLASVNYKMPLVWIDLEMTGLDVEVDRILEIACIITDGKLTKTIEGPDLVIYQTKECMDRMGEWCQNHHGATGLTEKVLRSTISERVAEEKVADFVKRNVGAYIPLLAGNSVYMDYLFLKKYMPELASLFSHVLVDVSSIKALCIRWYPGDYKKAPSKKNCHRAMDDIRESIMELKYYRDSIFKALRPRK